MRVPFAPRARPKSSTLEELLAEAQGGNSDARERLLNDYLPFILRVASEVSRRYLTPGVDDEVTIGMMAFDEAISRYDRSKKVSFLSFSEMVVKRRLVDYYRKEQQVRREIPVSVLQSEAEEDGKRTVLDAAVEVEADTAYLDRIEEVERREEIVRFGELLKEYGISLTELVRISPKHGDARARALEVARIIATDVRLREYLMENKRLPIKELEGRVQCSRKTLKRQRRYIMAICLILVGDFPYLREYIGMSQDGI